MMKMNDSAVRSIRIASTLTDRFAAIVKEAATTISPDHVELLVGEAQQIYPEIWRHLDDARTELAGRGAATTYYDSLRASQHGQHAVKDIQSVVDPMSLNQFKSATFNEDGYTKMRTACDALMRAMPEVDWRALALADESAIAQAGSLKPSFWSWLSSL
ncbi:MAG TPA: hypothetical protein VL326_31610 [Kofleriaceae bacterium]|nr:hypothetical protein [Kofleriaceae bacterium]